MDFNIVRKGFRKGAPAPVPASPCQFFEGRHQHIDLFFGIVEAKACPDRAVREPEPFHERLAAVVAGADKDLGGLVQPAGLPRAGGYRRP